MTPLGFFVDRVLGYRAQRANSASINSDCGAGHVTTGRFVHEGHELVGEAGHGAADADAADVGAAADARHPASLAHVALHDGTPATELHDAFGRAILLGEVGLLVVAAAVAALVDGRAEQ